MGDNLNRQQFSAVTIQASDLQPGDRIDKGGKIRVHRVAVTASGSVVAGLKIKGSKAPGIKQHHVSDVISVYRAKQ